MEQWTQLRLFYMRDFCSYTVTGDNFKAARGGWYSGFTEPQYVSYLNDGKI